MPNSFLFFQSIVNYRIPVNDDGTLGSPEITGKWTRPRDKGTKKLNKKKRMIQLVTEKIEEEYV